MIRLLTILILSLVVCNAQQDTRLLKFKKLKGGVWMPAVHIPQSEIPMGVPNLYVWYRPEGLTNLVEGLPVNNWPDSSGNHIDGIPRSQAQAPITTNNVANGYAGVWFDGVATHFTNAASCIQTNSLFLVMKPYSNGVNFGTYTFVLDGNNPSSLFSGLGLYYPDNVYTNLSPISCGVANFAGTVPGITNLFFVEIQYASTSGQFYTNGVQAAVGTHSYPCNWTNGMTIGCEVDQSHLYKGYIIEMIMYTNTYLTQATGTGTVNSVVSGYLRRKYFNQ